MDICGYLWIFVDICGYSIQSYLHAGRPNLIQIIPSMTFWLQDDKSRDVDTLGEFYSFRLRIVTEL